MTSRAQEPVIPYEILDNALSDYTKTTLEPPLTYGEWQLVEFPTVAHQVTDQETLKTILKSEFVFRNVESDYYYRAVFLHNANNVLRHKPLTVKRVERKMVPVYVDL